MEHFKKRLIHQHQGPYTSKLSSKAVLEDGDDDASSNSSTNSCSNSMIRPENKKEGNNPQLKVARKRAVCRSKFRHNSLKIFKLGTSIPTSLCKSREPYNVSAEKNLQLCCEENQGKRKNKKYDKPNQKESITEQIINSIEGNKKDNFQRSISANLDNSTKFPGKHNLPAIISEIPVKRRNSLTRSSEDEQKNSDSCRVPCDDSDYMKFDNHRAQSIYKRRNTVLGTEVTRTYLSDPNLSNSMSYNELNEHAEKTVTVCNNEIPYKLTEKVKSISPDSTFTEKEIISSVQYPSLKHIYNNIRPIFTPSSSKAPESMHTSLPVNILLPQNTSITPIVPTRDEIYQHNPQNNSTPKRSSSNFHNSSNTSNNNYLQNEYLHSMLPVQIETTERINSLMPNLDNPINLSVKRNNESNTRNLHLPYPDEFNSNKRTFPFPYSEEIFKNGRHFPEIQQQISRLENTLLKKPFELYKKSVEESIARATVQRVKSVMLTPFSVENLLVLNDSYKKLSNLIGSKKLSSELIRNLKVVVEEIIIYTNSKLFNNKSQISRNYTQQIMEFDLEHHRALLKDVIHLLQKNCYDYVWMGHFLIVLSRNRSDIPQISPTNWSNSSLYPSLMSQYFPLDEKELHQKLYKTKRPQIKKSPHQPKLLSYSDPLYNSNNIKNESYPSDSRYFPPKQSFNIISPESIEVKNNLLEFKNKPQKDHQLLMRTPKVDKENDFAGNADMLFVNDTVIVKDKSMKVTRGNTEIGIKKGNEVDKNDVIVERLSKTEIPCIQKESAEKNEIKQVSTDDLHLFKELLKQEDKNIYNRILNKLIHVKEIAKDVITIDDEEDKSTKSNRLRDILTKSKSTFSHPPPNKVNTSLKSPDVVIIDDDSEDKGFKEQKSDLNKNYLSISKFLTPSKTELQETAKKLLKRKVTSKKLPENNIIREKNPQPIESIGDTKTDKKFVSVHPSDDKKRKKLKLDIKKPLPYKISIGSTPEHSKYEIFESPEVFVPPNNIGRPYLSQTTSCRTPENVSPIIVHSPIDLNSPVTPYSNLGPLSTKAGVNSNWKSWISEERKKGFLDARPPTQRRQSVETISSVGSDYSPNLDHDENYVKIRVDAKWYRVKKSVMESIPRGKLCYVRENNYLIRYYDDNQLSQFIQNMNVSLVDPSAFDFLKQIRDRVDGYLSDDIFITPYEITEKNQAIQLAENISFTKDDYISIPELYVEEVEKVERFVPKDFLGFYKYVTGYQIVNNHHPISFQTFLTMHNTNGIKMFYKRYLLSILENKYE